MLDLRISTLNHVMESFKKEYYNEITGKKRSENLPEASLPARSRKNDDNAELSTDEILSQRVVPVQKEANSSGEDKPLDQQYDEFLEANPKYVKYLELSEAEKDSFAKMQQDFRGLIRNLVTKRVTGAEMLQLLKKAEEND